MLDGYLISDEAAVHLGITRQTLYNFAATRDDFPAPLRVGRTVLWPVDGLDDWRARHPARRKKRDSPAP